MEVAKAFALRSTCSRAQVGVVIAREGRILSTGYNGAPPGVEHCDHQCDCAAYDAVGQITGKEVDRHTFECASRQPCKKSVHAEANAIAFAARNGVAIDGAELFTTLTPCLPCAQLIASACIVRVVALDPYRDQSGWEILREAKIRVEKLAVV
jgi:dCMP deaminase